MELLLLTRAVYPLHGYGGMERHCYDWICAMTNRGCNVHVVTMTPTDAAELSSFPQNVFFYFIPGSPARKILHRITTYPLWVDRVNVFLRRFVSKQKIDAIYAHGLAAAGCTNLNVPVFYNPHGMEEFKCSGLKRLAYTPFRRLARNAARTARKVIATDQILVSEIERFLLVPRERIAVIPNAVRLDAPHALEIVPIENGDPLMLAAGRLEENKGFPILLQALAAAKGLPENWKLVIVGSGSMEVSLRKMAQHPSLKNHVILMGQRTEQELNSLYSQADLFLNPTLYEGSSIVTLEAMKYGLPVIASAAGGLPDKIADGINGWLAPPGDVPAWRDTIQKAFASREIWKPMGQNSVRIVQEKYSWDKAADLYLALFQERP